MLGLKSSTIVFTVLALLSLVTAVLVWQLASRNERMAKPAFEKSIRYDGDFSFTNGFTVAFKGVYWVDVVCPRTNAPGVIRDLPTHIPVRQSIICDGNILAEGISPNPDTAFYAEKVAYHTLTFTGEVGKNYEISFQNDKPMAAIDATKPSLRIRLSQRTSISGLFVHLCSHSLACIIAVVGLLLAVPPCIHLVMMRYRREMRAAQQKKECR